MNITPDFVKELKTVIDTLECVTKLQGDLQQQLSKSDGGERGKVATELANAVIAHGALIDRRRELLESLGGDPPPPPQGSAPARRRSPKK